MKLFFRGVIVAAIASIVALGAIMPAMQAYAASSAALSIVPKKNYTIEPGKSVEDKLTIRNIDTTNPLELTLRVVDFTYLDEGGAPKLMLAEDAPQTTWSLKPFLTLPKTVTIEPNSTKTIDMKVAIPAGHGAGSYYSAIVYSSGTSEGGNVGLNASGVTLVFTSIPGDVKEDLQLQKFGAYNMASQSGGAGYVKFAMQQPEAIGYTLKNNGNVTESPVGTITLKHIFGKEQIISDVNPNSSLALIGQTRTFTACIKYQSSEINLGGQTTKSKGCTIPGLWPGLYTVSLDLFYGQNGNQTKDITGTTFFWYLPMWFIITLLVVIAVLAFYIRKIVRKIRGTDSRGSRYNMQSRRR